MGHEWWKWKDMYMCEDVHGMSTKNGNGPATLNEKGSGSEE